MFEGLFQPMHLLVIGIIAILLFGKRLPDIARSLGKSMVEHDRAQRYLQIRAAADRAAEALPADERHCQDSREDPGDHEAAHRAWLSCLRELRPAHHS